MLKNKFNLAKSALLEPSGLSEADLSDTLDAVLSHHVDYADLYFQTQHAESWMLEQGIVKDAGYDIERGVGVRAVSGEKTGFAYSDDISKEALTKAAHAARSISSDGQDFKMCVAKREAGHSLYTLDNPLLSVAQDEKVNLLKQLEGIARKEDPRVSQVIVSLSGLHEMILVMASDGTFACDVRPLVRLNVAVIAESKGRFEEGSCGGGGRCTYTDFFSDGIGEFYAKEAVRQALVNLDAKAAPAGQMPVVLGPGWPAVLLHEAVGHGLEGDFNRKGTSVFANKMGEQVASRLCTIVDNGRLPNLRGSLNVDDEGVPTQETVLIENGVLKGFMQDKLNARLTKTKPTGNGRRASFACLPIPRMTNTYMQAGEHAPEEIIKSVKKGLYAVNFAGGQVDITSGNFVFTTSEAYLIENGKVTTPVKGVSLIGSGSEVLNKVSMVGNDLAFDHGVGVCGKEGQSVPVGVGQPTLKVDQLTVGGSNPTTF